MRPLLLALVMLGLAASASAASIADAQAFVNSASQAFRKGDFAAALEALRKAEPIVAEANDPTLAAIRFNIARCLEELGRSKEALDAYALYLRTPDDSARKSRAQLAVKSLKRKVFGGIAVTCEPAGAMVTITGLVDTPTACPVRKEEVKPGTYQVKVAFDGYTPAERELTVGAGDPTALTVALDKEAKAGGVVMPDMQPPAEPVDPWPWVLTGGGALAIAGGVGLTLAAAGARDDAEAAQPGAARDGFIDDFERNETLSWIAYGFGGAAVLTGLILLTADDDDAAATAGWRLTGNGVQVRW